MNENLKMGSLFDGSGGFPLASTLCGITPVWASEIEPFPIRVTKQRFPNMKHYGDISQINVEELETVDLITGGSPCQDMSVAGKRKGMSKHCPECDYQVVGNDEVETCPQCGTKLEYTRSGLFMEQIRIVKEMRKNDKLRKLQSGRTDESIRPRFMLWENVTGAFSSNKGEDFRAVLEETAKIADRNASIPRPEKGKWKNAGLIVGDGYSIAWRVFDAQYWGVPQRRRRIALVADFGGESAGEVLFKRDGLSWNFTESSKAWEKTPGNTAESTGETGENEGTRQTDVEARTICLNDQGGSQIAISENKVNTLRAETHGNNPIVMEPQYSVDFGRTADRIQMNPDKSVTLLGEGGGAGAKTGLYCLPEQSLEPITMQIRCGKEGGGKGALLQNNKSATLSTSNVQTLFQPTKAYGISSYDSNAMKSSNPHSGIYEAETSRTLDLNGGNPACNQGGIAICEPIAYRKTSHPRTAEEGQGWEEAKVNDTLNVFDAGEKRTPTIVCEPKGSNQYMAYSLQGSMIGREEKNGPQGSGVNEDVSFTLNTTDRHAVCYQDKIGALCASDYKWPQNQQLTDNKFIVEEHETTFSASKASYFTHAEEELANTLVATDYKDTPIINDRNNFMEYIVRRLTPLECSRLQGFPDWWTDGLLNKKPSEEEMEFWREVFETHRRIVSGSSKAKTDKQIKKWLEEEPNDGALYKMWGNGIALPCFLYVVEGIKEILERKQQ